MNFNKLLTAAAVCTIAVVGCQKNSEQEIIEQVNTIEYNLFDRIDEPIVFLGTAGTGYIGEAITSISRNVVTSSDEAYILVVKTSEMMAHVNEIQKASSIGKAIVEIEPINSVHASFWHSLGEVSYLDPNQATNDLLILATCGNSCYQLQNPFLEDTYGATDGIFYGEPEEATESSAADRKDLVNQRNIPVPIGPSAAFLRTKLNALAKWLDEQIYPTDSQSSVIPTFDGDLSKYITDASRCQHIVKTYNVGADNYAFSEVIGSDADRVTRHSTVDLSMYIAPLYSYELNGKDLGGDYYFVSMSVVSHNQPLYGLYKVWHGWVRTWAHIFYGKKLNIDATLLNSDKNSIGDDIVFFETPHPTTTSCSTSYTTGYSSTLNISGQGGISGGSPTGTLTVGGSFTWSNSQTRNVQDQSIDMSTDPSSRGVHYCYWCNNDREEDETSDAVPGIARTDQNCEGSWCWHVKNTKDNDSTNYYILKLEVNPVYAYRWRHATWRWEGNYAEKNLLAEDQRTTYFEVKKPNRTKNGIFEIKSTNSQYMYGLKILDLEGKVIAKDDGAYEKNFTQRYQIPVGTYNVEYEIRDGDTGKSLGNYRISNVVINTAQTTSKSTLDGKII